jgi:hypothetical protein
VAISGVDNIRIYSLQIAVPGKTKAQRERELLDARVSRERELTWPYNRRETGFDHIPKTDHGSLNDAGREGKSVNASISSPRGGVKESFNSVPVLTESSVVREAKVTKSRIASMERQGRDWSDVVSGFSVTLATLIIAGPGRLPAHLLFAAAVALAGLSSVILFVTVIMGFTSICRSWRQDHRLRIIRSPIRQRRNNAAHCTNETRMVLPEVNAKTPQEHYGPHERTSAPTPVYLD